MASYLPRSCTAIQDHDLSVLNHLGRRATDRHFPLCRDQLTACEIRNSGRGGQSPAVDSLKKPFLSHLSQVATDCVLRDAHRLTYFFGNHLPIAFQKRISYFCLPTHRKGSRRSHNRTSYLIKFAFP